MTLVRNHRPQLSGNKWLFFALGALALSACSPKVRPVPPKEAEPAIEVKEKPVVKAPPRISAIAMILPFDIDNVNIGAHYSKPGLKRAYIALDFYQGFRLALDSLTNLGYNYKLQLFDSREQAGQSHSLAYNPAIRSSDLIVGPVFPDDIKAFTSVLTSGRKPIVSPLSPAPPSTFKNQNLVTVAPPLEYHAWVTAKYISEKVKPKKVFVLKSGFSEENKYVIPFKQAIDSLSKKKIQIISVSVVRGKLDNLTAQLSLKEENIFLIPSTNQAFLVVTLRSLDSLAKKFPVILFGHPSWEKFSFLRTQLLQRLKTHITSADRVNYRSAATNNFIHAYFRAYHVNPSEYAIMGYDEGLYFGSLLGANPEVFKNLDQTDFVGLHNKFHFEKKPGVGWINTHVDILKYTNFELKKVE